MAITRANVLTAVQANDRVGQTIDTSKANSWLNDFDQIAHEIKIGIAPIEHASTQDYTVTSAPQTKDLPADFQTINKRNLGFFIVNSDSDAPEIRLSITSPGSSQQGYYFTTGDQVVFTGITNRTVRLFYVALVEGKTSYSGTDSVDIPDRFIEFANSYLRFRHFLERDEREQMLIEEGNVRDWQSKFTKGIRRHNNPIAFKSPMNIINY